MLIIFQDSNVVVSTGKQKTVNYGSACMWPDPILVVH